MKLKADDSMGEAPSKPPFLTVEGVSKAFGAVRALRDVSLEFHAGEVHGLVGANGAGKLTLLNVLGGVVRPDSGVVKLDGEPITIAGPRHAAALGFSFIHQDLALVPQFTAIENMTLGRPATSFLGLRDGPKRRAAVRGVANRLQLSFSLDRPVNELSVAERGLVEIGRALVGKARMVAMDEPTASLSDAECERLFAIVRELTASGVVVIYVSHRLDEIEQLSDRVTIFKDGRIVDRRQRGGYIRADLVAGITSAAPRLSGERSRETRSTRETLLQVRHLNRPPRVQDVSFVIHEGEILGLAGVVGAGRTEVARLIFGADRLLAGEMVLRGQPFAPSSTLSAIRAGVALVPEERRSQALVMQETVSFNVNMGSWKQARLWTWLPLISDRRARHRTRDVAQHLQIEMRGVGSPVRTLSGGNQQKVAFGRWLARESSLLLLDEPTRGVDVGARDQIWQLVEDFAARGKSVLAICSELQELSHCHRVIVLVEGRDIAELRGPGVTEDDILRVIYGAREQTEVMA